MHSSSNFNETLEGTLMLLLVVAPFIVSGAVTFGYSRSLLSLLLMLGGAIIGAVLILISGIYWLHLLACDWVESQAVGFIFLPVILPLYAYTGAVSGTALVAILYGYSRDKSSSLWFYIASICFTTILSGLILSTKVSGRSSSNLESTSQQSNKTPQAWNRIILLPIMTFGIGWISAYLGSRLAFFLVVQGLESLL